MADRPIAVGYRKSFPTLGETIFTEATFHEEANFFGARFLGQTYFSHCRFEERSDFSWCIYPPKKRLLCSIDPRLRSDLDKGTITDHLRKELEDKGISVSRNGSAWVVEEGERWIIVRRPETEVYPPEIVFVDREGGKLNIYQEGARMYFNGVTGFSEMTIKWQYEPLFSVAGMDYRHMTLDSIAGPVQDKDFGLKGHLGYDETFYIALIENYKAMGWFAQADDAYYTYRKQKRQNRLGLLEEDIRLRAMMRSNQKEREYSLWDRFFVWCSDWFQWIWAVIVSTLERYFLEIPFGYGVKKWKLFRSFLLLWIPFSLYYTRFLRRPGEWFSQGIREWNPFRDRCRCLGWAAIHSLNILTPGIDLQSMRFIKASRYELFRPESRRFVWVQRFQQISGWYLLVLFLVMFGKIWIR